MPSIAATRTKDGDLRWRVRFRLKGSYSSKTFDTEADAVEFAKLCDDLGDTAAALRYLVRLDDAERIEALTLDQWFSVGYIGTRSGIQERTVIDYQRTYDRHIKPALGRMPIDAITKSHVAAFVNALDRSGLSGKTVANVHGLLAAALNEAVQERKIERNPCKGVKLPRDAPDSVDARFLTHAEFWRLYEHITPLYQPLVLTLVGTGMRWAEATALRVGEVDLDGLGTIKIIRATKWTPGKGHTDDGVTKTKKSRRTIIAAWQVREAIRPLLVGKKRDDHVFLSARGLPVRHATFHRLVWTTACKKAELDPAPRIHDLRHTHASWLLEQGMSLEQVQDQLGHESIITTRKTYGHLQPAMLEALQKAAAASLSAGAPQWALEVGANTNSSPLELGAG
jgi:integrase